MICTNSVGLGRSGILGVKLVTVSNTLLLTYAYDYDAPNHDMS